MDDELILEGKKYISSKRLSHETGYTFDYISRLCREAKIEGKLLGRNWFVNPDSLLSYKTISRQSQKQLAKNDGEKEFNVTEPHIDNWEQVLFTAQESGNENQGKRRVLIKKDLNEGNISSRQNIKEKNKNYFYSSLFMKHQPPGRALPKARGNQKTMVARSDSLFILYLARRARPWMLQNKIASIVTIGNYCLILKYLVSIFLVSIISYEVFVNFYFIESLLSGLFEQKIIIDTRTNF